MRVTFPVRTSLDFEALYPEASRSATESAMNLVKTGEMILARVADLLRPFGLSPAGGQILSMLSDSPEALSPGQIRERLLVAGPTVTGLIDSLEKKHLARRLVHPSDRRRQLVEITDEGRAVARAFRPIVHSAQRPWLECLTDDEQTLLINWLGRIQAHLTAASDSRTDES
jgi:DNA-binding MarR family transcriptional regulator